MVSTKTHQVDVSVIIINYNSSELIDDCLNSFNNYSSGFTYEIIIVDNSNDASLKSILEKYKYINLIVNKENIGFAAANNQGLKIAKGKYILFLNNDTIFIENTISKILEYICDDNDQKIIGCKLLNKDGSLQHSVLDYPTLWNTFTSNFFLYVLFPKSKYFNKYHLMNNKISTISEVQVVTGAFMFCPTSIIKQLSGFDERFFFYAEEMDICKRFSELGGKVIYFPETSIIHLKGVTASKNLWFLHKNRSIATIKFMQKHFGAFKAQVGVLIHFIGLVVRIQILIIGGLVKFNKNMIYLSLIYLKLLFVYPKNVFKNH